MATQADTNEAAETEAFMLHMMAPGLHLIPPHMHDAIKGYIVHGWEPGGFLSALLCNDFMRAAGKADDENAAALLGWARFLYNHVPSSSYGSPANFGRWIEKGGAIGGAVA